MNEKSARAFFKLKYKELKHRIHGNYSFKFNNNLSRAGVCKFYTKELGGIIEISRVYLNNKKTTKTMVKNTILHEIAHAICGPEAMHNKFWRETALSIGCDGKRCVPNFRPKSSYKYQLQCKKGCKMFRSRINKNLLHTVYRCKQHNEPIQVLKKNAKSKKMEKVKVTLRN